MTGNCHVPPEKDPAAAGHLAGGLPVSRAVVAARWGHAENAVALRETLRIGLASRGRPDQTYVDNGAMFIDSGLRRACAVLGIKLSHSAPGRPRLTG